MEVIDGKTILFQPFDQLPVQEIRSPAFHAGIACRAKQIDCCFSYCAADETSTQLVTGLAQHDFHLELLG